VPATAEAVAHAASAHAAVATAAAYAIAVVAHAAHATHAALAAHAADYRTLTVLRRRRFRHIVAALPRDRGGAATRRPLRCCAASAAEVHLRNTEQHARTYECAFRRSRRCRLQGVWRQT